MSLKFNFSNSRVAGRLTESRTRQHKCAQPNFEFRLFRFSDNKSNLGHADEQWPHSVDIIHFKILHAFHILSVCPPPWRSDSEYDIMCAELMPCLTCASTHVCRAEFRVLRTFSANIFFSAIATVHQLFCISYPPIPWHSYFALQCFSFSCVIYDNLLCHDL